jgi:flagellar hook assembly protein FlgD
LGQNYPNPFNPSTQIRYGLPKASYVTLTVHNVLGQEVARIVDEAQTEGYYDVRWNGTNESGGIVGTGVYFFRIHAGDFTETRKMLLVK